MMKKAMSETMFTSCLFVVLFFLLFAGQIAAQGEGERGSELAVRPCSDLARLQQRCYNGGLCLEVSVNGTLGRLCHCPAGFTGARCSQRSAPCSPDPCGRNGFCRYADDSAGYVCQCKPGFAGRHCERNVNNCAGVVCHNGGLCVDQVNSYECECKWPFAGRDCSRRLSCNDTELVCKNNGRCVEEKNDDEEAAAATTSRPVCRCAAGFEGPDCGVQVDRCRSQPCQNAGVCLEPSAPGDDGYRCQCPFGFYGRDCEFENVCLTQEPCQSNAKCVNLADFARGAQKREADGVASRREFQLRAKYFCLCNEHYTGLNCEVRLDQSTTTTTTTLAPVTRMISALVTTTTTTTTTMAATKSNGSFVLVLNIEPAEFVKQKDEILGLFQKRFGILINVRRGESDGREMIYPFRSSASESTWTKVYFSLLFACVYEEKAGDESQCLQSQVRSAGDVLGILSALNARSSDLLPNAIRSNVTYEAESLNGGGGHGSGARSQQNGSAVATYVPLGLAVLVLVAITVAVNVIMRQNAVKRVKAPIWMPPPSDAAFDGFVELSAKKHLTASSHLWSKTTTATATTTGDESPPSSDGADNDYYCVTGGGGVGEFDPRPAVKTRKLDFQTRAAPAAPLQHSIPDYYPSPPESLPGDNSLYHSAAAAAATLNTANLKGGAAGLTPLMCFIMSRARARKSTPSGMQHQQQYETAELLDMYVAKGADLNVHSLSDGETALHMAARSGLVDVCERLIRHGADPQLFDNYGRTVLHTAVGSNEYECVRLILSHCSTLAGSVGSDSAPGTPPSANQVAPTGLYDDKFDLVDVKTNDYLGETALICAARLGLNALVKLLIEHNASVNATDNNGQSALHWCAKVNNVHGALLLVQSGANVNMLDESEKTPLSCALDELNTKDVCDLLVKFEASMTPEDQAKYVKMAQILQSLNTAGNVDNERLIMSLASSHYKPPNVDSKPLQSHSQPPPPPASLAHRAAKPTVKTEPVASSFLGQFVSSTKRKFSETFNVATSRPAKKCSAKPQAKKPASLELNVVDSPCSGAGFSHQRDYLPPKYTPLTPSPPQSGFKVNNNTSSESSSSNSSSTGGLLVNNYYASSFELAYAKPTAQSTGFGEFAFQQQQQQQHNYTSNNEYENAGLYHAYGRHTESSSTINAGLYVDESALAGPSAGAVNLAFSTSDLGGQASPYGQPPPVYSSSNGYFGHQTTSQQYSNIVPGSYAAYF